MELPVAAESYHASPDALVRAVKRVNVVTGRMTAAETQLDTATAFTNPQRPLVYGGNFAADVRPVDGLPAEQAIDQILEHFASQDCVCRMMIGNETQWPAGLAAALQQHGYQADTNVVCSVKNYVRPTKLNGDLQIVPGRSMYPQLRAFRRQAELEQHRGDAPIAEQIASWYIDALDEPRLEVFLGRLGGQAVGLINLVTLGQIGVIEWVYTAESARRQAVATTLLAHAMDHCQRALFDNVILEAAAGDQVLGLYQRLGFLPVATYANYVLSDA